MDRPGETFEALGAGPARTDARLLLRLHTAMVGALTLTHLKLAVVALDTLLEHISANSNFEDVVLDVIVWAHKQDRLRDVAEAALARAPSNAVLAAVVDEIRNPRAAAVPEGPSTPSLVPTAGAPATGDIASDRLRPTLRKWLGAHLPHFGFLALCWVGASAVISILLTHVFVVRDRVPVVSTTAQLCLVLTILFDFHRHGPLFFTQEGEFFYKSVETRMLASAQDDVWRRHGHSAVESQKQFFGGVRLLMIGWAMLYGALLAQHLVQRSGLPAPTLVQKIFAGAATAANNLATLGILVSFCVMTFVTTPETGGTGAGAPDVEESRKIIRRIYFAVTVAWMLLLAANVVALSVRGLDNGAWDNAQSIFDATSGLVASVSFALLVGRFDSKFIDANPWVLFCLYCYASIQPLWIFAATHGGSAERLFTTLLYVVAMALKIVLYPFLCWLMQSGRLLFYFGRVRDLQDTVHLDWKRETRQNYPSAQTRYGFRRRTLVAVGLAFSLFTLLGAATAPFDPPPAVIFVGSGTVASYLHCVAQLHSDLRHNPRTVILRAGTETGYSVSTESDNHGKVGNSGVSLIGLTFGDPDEEQIKHGNQNNWAIASVMDGYPLSVLVRGVTLATTPCEIRTPHLAAIDSCTYPKEIVNLWTNRTDSIKAQQSLPEKWLVTDKRSGTRKQFDQLLYASGLDGEPRALWDHLPGDAAKKYTTDYAVDWGDLSKIPVFIAFGLPSYNSNTGDCTAPNGVVALGVCEKDAGECKPKTAGLGAYFRLESCQPGRPCRVPELEEPICHALVNMYSGLENPRGEAWARAGCAVTLPYDGRIATVDWNDR